MRAFLVLAALVACTLAQCVWKDQTGRTWDLTRANRASADYETAPNASTFHRVDQLINVGTDPSLPLSRALLLVVLS